MKTNDIKKGTRVRLANGWMATIMDNKKGTIRMAEVHGYYTEMGSIYTHDITHAVVNDDLVPIEYTKDQLKLREAVTVF